MPNNDIRGATSNYTFSIVLENGTQLELNNLNEDIHYDVSVPIRDLNISNFDYAKYFQDFGYDIYNS